MLYYTIVCAKEKKRMASLEELREQLDQIDDKIAELYE